jgi:hypothetical protein
MKTLVHILFLLSLCATTSVEARKNASSPDDCRDLDVISYTAPTVMPLKDRIIIKRMTDNITIPTATDEEIEKRSPQGTARLIFSQQPDFEKNGPWSTKIRIVGNKAHPINLSIEFRDHSNAGVNATWLNEKLIFMRVWWGRIVSTDFILNVETGEPIYTEEASYQNIILSCDEKLRMFKQR